MLSVDIDGTILFDRAISLADAAAMRRWREAGNLLVMNTGRSISALRSALDGFDVDYDYAVLYTGAVLTDGRAGVIEARTLPDGLIEEILDVLGREERITIFATTLDGDLQLHDTLGSGTDLLTLFRRGTTADLAGRGVKALVIACNSASSAVLRDARERYDMPILEVILPAARRALTATSSGSEGIAYVSVAPERMTPPTLGKRCAKRPIGTDTKTARAVAGSAMNR